MAVATSRRADECCVRSVTGLNHSQFFKNYINKTNKTKDNNKSSTQNANLKKWSREKRKRKNNNYKTLNPTSLLYACEQWRKLTILHNTEPETSRGEVPKQLSLSRFIIHAYHLIKSSERVCILTNAVNLQRRHQIDGAACRRYAVGDHDRRSFIIYWQNSVSGCRMTLREH